MKYRLALIVSLLMIATTLLSYPGETVAGIPVPSSRPTGLTFDGRYLWVADHETDKLTCLDPGTGEIVKEIASPGFWPMGLAWDGKYLWNIDLRQGKIFQVDPADGTIRNTISAPRSNVEGLAWDGETLWVTDPSNDLIMKIDLSDGTAVQIFPAPAENPQGLTFDGTYLWCSDRILDEIHMIDPENGEVIMVLQSPGPYSRGLAWDGRYLWNVDYQSDSLYQIIRDDEELYRLNNPRHARVTLTHEVKAYGKGNLQTLDLYIAVPEKLPQQKIFDVAFSPDNYRTVDDRWNQAFAHIQYSDIQAEATIRSTMTVGTTVSEITYFIFPDKCGTLKDIPRDLKRLYTADGSKYLLEDPYIRNLADDIVGEETNPYWMARRIFDYVRNTLEYKLEGGWNVAPVVLQRGTGSCSEYTFSFIALCRAAGIPARYVGAIVVRGDDASLDIYFHRWPQVYLPNYGWVTMDPQGGDKELPRDRAMGIGHLSNRFLITTQGGGDSEYLGWYYNYFATYNTDPQVQINIEEFAEWEPLLSEE
ncbi:transglutaminase domain-containing protein [Candidatus Neomarinimicrobiota bacterium]